MRVGDVMTRGVECIHPDACLREAAAMMANLDVGTMPVCEKDHLVGMLTDRDITVRATSKGAHPSALHVRDIMTRDVIYCFEDQPVEEAARLMEEKQVRRLVVLNSLKRLVGIVSLGDLAVETGDEHLTAKALEAVSEPNRPVRPPSVEHA